MSLLDTIYMKMTSGKWKIPKGRDGFNCMPSFSIA